MDRDAAQVPVLAGIQWQGRLRKALLQATKNGLWYVLDRSTGQLLMSKPFVDPAALPAREATNWYPFSYSPISGLFYLAASESKYGAVRAFDTASGERKWEFKRDSASFTTGAMTTASGLLFTGVTSERGDFYALDADTGELLWQRVLPGWLKNGPISYSVDGKQYVAIAADNTLFAFALRQ